MNKIKKILYTLIKPSVLISVTTEIIAILMLFKINLDKDMILNIITGVSSILILLGIISSSDGEKISMPYNIMYCENCKKETQHIRLGKKMICKDCGEE